MYLGKPRDTTLCSVPHEIYLEKNTTIFIQIFYYNYFSTQSVNNIRQACRFAAEYGAILTSDWSNLSRDYDNLIQMHWTFIVNGADRTGVNV